MLRQKRRLDGDLAACPTLEALYLLCTPNLSLESVNAVINQLRLGVHDIYHTELVRDPLTDSWTKEGVEIIGPGIKFSQPVTEIIWVGVTYREQRPIEWTKLEPQDTGRFDMWSDSNMRYIRYSLDNTPLPPARLLTGLINGTCSTAAATRICLYEPNRVQEMCHCYTEFLQAELNADMTL